MSPPEGKTGVPREPGHLPFLTQSGLRSANWSNVTIRSHGTVGTGLFSTPSGLV